MCSPKLKSVIIGSNGQQLAILGLSKLVVLLIKRVFHLSFKKPTRVITIDPVCANNTEKVTKNLKSQNQNRNVNQKIIFAIVLMLLLSETEGGIL